MASPRLPEAKSLFPSFERIISSGQLTKGKELSSFEAEAAEYLGVGHCVGVSSCTSGLMLCFQALAKKRGSLPRPKVAVPSFTFLASITALLWAGWEPVFVDVDPSSMNICLQDLEKVLEQEGVVAVLAVHCFGNPVPTAAIQALCDRHGASLMFDAAHGFGATHEGRKVGNGGWCEIFSLTPTKMVVAGEGGLIATNDPDLAQSLRIGREYGNDGRYDTVFPGLNARLSELHCALARGSLGLLEEVVAQKNKMACLLTGALTSVEGVGFQKISEGSRTTYKDFTITIDPEIFGTSRDRVAAALLAEGIPSRKYFSPPCHQHAAFQEFHQRPLPKTEELAQRCLSLPVLDEGTVEGIAAAFHKIHSHAQELSEHTEL